MLTREDVRPLSVALGSGTLVGLAVGLWLSLPSYLAQPASAGAEPEQISQVDPNLARYNQMIAANGINATPYILAVGYAPPSAAQIETAQFDIRDAAAADPAADNAERDPAPPQLRPIFWVSRVAESATTAPYDGADRTVPTPAAEPAPAPAPVSEDTGPAVSP
jgi:hypothetical protein